LVEDDRLLMWLWPDECGRFQRDPHLLCDDRRRSALATSTREGTTFLAVSKMNPPCQIEYIHWQRR